MLMQMVRFSMRSGFRILSAALLLMVITGLVAFSVYRPDKALRVATGFVAHTMCSEVFVSGFDPAKVFEQSIAPFRYRGTPAAVFS
jgi:hypothetical protein